MNLCLIFMLASQTMFMSSEEKSLCIKLIKQGCGEFWHCSWDSWISQTPAEYEGMWKIDIDQRVHDLTELRDFSRPRYKVTTAKGFNLARLLVFISWLTSLMNRQTSSLINSFWATQLQKRSAWNHTKSITSSKSVLFLITPMSSLKSVNNVTSHHSR